MVKGEQKVIKEGDITKYVGFAQVEVRAINPTREELNKLLGKEDAEDDKPIVYLSEDTEGNQKLRLSFWLYNEDKDRFFPYSINLTRKDVVSKDGIKTQYINSTCSTSWTDDENNLPVWFTSFTEKDTKEIVGKQLYRKAILGEGDVATLIRSWLGRLNFYSPTTEVFIDIDKLFKENYSELRELIEGDYDTPFIVLLGVKTDENDSSKQYQQVYGRGFLPANFYKFILKGNKFSSGYAERIWNKFEDDVSGQYGFTSYFELVPLCEYDRKADPAVSEVTQKKEEVTPVNSKY